MHRSIWHKDHAPQELITQFPDHRVLNDTFIYFSAWLEDLNPDADYDYIELTESNELDEDGFIQPLSTDDMMPDISSLMYNDYAGEIRVTNSQARKLQAAPEWRIYTGQYEDDSTESLKEDLLEADVLNAGLAIAIDRAKVFTEQIGQAKTALKQHLDQRTLNSTVSDLKQKYPGKVKEVAL